MTDGQKITIYVIGLGLVAIIFALLQRQEKNVKKKKTINLLGGLSIPILMFVFGLWFGPWKPFSLFAVLAIAGVFIENRYIYYCESCGRRQHRLLSKSEFCSKCGKKY
jgi:uncharacterized membrane protein